MVRDGDTQGATERLARFAAELQFDDIPHGAIHQAKLAILDCIGVSMAAATTDTGAAIKEHVRLHGGRGPADVITGPHGVSPTSAALANGTLAHALDFDDRGHATTHTLAAALALGQARAASGRDLLTAYVAGREIRMALDAAMDFYAGRREGRGPGSRGWHATGSNGSLAAAAAASRIIGLDVPGTRMALGIAASFAGGLGRNFGTMTKPLHAGHAAESGVRAALFATDGFTADPEILEAPGGYLSAMCLPGEVEVDGVGRDLGERWDLVEPGARIKPYPCCTGTHAGIETALAMRANYGLTAQDIDRIEMDLRPGVLIRLKPDSGMEGRFSMAYCVATAFEDGAVEMPHFEDGFGRSATVQRLVESAVHAPDSGVLTIVTASGATHTDAVLPLRNLREAEVIEKFRACAARAFASPEVERTLSSVMELERAGTVSDLLPAMVVA